MTWPTSQNSPMPTAAPSGPPPARTAPVAAAAVAAATCATSNSAFGRGAPLTRRAAAHADDDGGHQPGAGGQRERGSDSGLGGAEGPAPPAGVQVHHGQLGQDDRDGERGQRPPGRRPPAGEDGQHGRSQHGHAPGAAERTAARGRAGAAAQRRRGARSRTGHDPPSWAAERMWTAQASALLRQPMEPRTGGLPVRVAPFAAVRWAVRPSALPSQVTHRTVLQQPGTGADEAFVQEGYPAPGRRGGLRWQPVWTVR